MEIKIPEVGESIREALLAKWFRKNGELVKKDEPLCEIETDKITLDINADASGRLVIQTDAGTSVAIGAVVGMIIEQPAEEPVSSGMSERQVLTADRPDGRISAASSPSIRREMREQGIAPDSVTGTGKGGRILAGDLSAVKETEILQTPVTDPRTAPQSSTATIDSSQTRFSAAPAPEAPPPVPAVRSEEAPSYNSSREVRKPMSPIRKRISEHLVAARQQTAMLTTFNEADLSRVKELREKHRDHFQKRHGVPLGLMPFFVKACVEALKEYPSVNASIDGDDIVYHNFYDIGIAIGAEKGWWFRSCVTSTGCGCMRSTRQLQRFRKRYGPITLLSATWKAVPSASAMAECTVRCCLLRSSIYPKAVCWVCMQSRTGR
jgi:2-oxoglutarate dehydrogenase E2 component (dihydrolipoamide succinyltransferase)